MTAPFGPLRNPLLDLLAAYRVQLPAVPGVGGITPPDTMASDATRAPLADAPPEIGPTPPDMTPGRQALLSMLFGAPDPGANVSAAGAPTMLDTIRQPSDVTRTPAPTPPNAMGARSPFAPEGEDVTYLRPNSPARLAKQYAAGMGNFGLTVAGGAVDAGDILGRSLMGDPVGGVRQAQEHQQQFKDLQERLGEWAGKPHTIPEGALRYFGPDLTFALAAKGPELASRVGRGVTSALQDAAFGTPEQQLADMTSGNYGILTAANPVMGGGDEATRMQMLKDALAERNVDAVPLTGHWEGSTEPSFLAPGLKPEDAVALGQRFGQHSVISNEGLHDVTTAVTDPVAGGPIMGADPKGNYSELLLNGRSTPFHLSFPTAGKPLISGGENGVYQLDPRAEAAFNEIARRAGVHGNKFPTADYVEPEGIMPLGQVRRIHADLASNQELLAKAEAAGDAESAAGYTSAIQAEQAQITKLMARMPYGTTMDEVLGTAPKAPPAAAPAAEAAAPASEPGSPFGPAQPVMQAVKDERMAGKLGRLGAVLTREPAPGAGLVSQPGIGEGRGEYSERAADALMRAQAAREATGEQLHAPGGEAGATEAERLLQAARRGIAKHLGRSTSEAATPPEEVAGSPTGFFREADVPSVEQRAIEETPPGPGGPALADSVATSGPSLLSRFIHDEGGELRLGGRPVSDYVPAVRVGKKVYTGSDHGIAFYNAERGGFKGTTESPRVEFGFQDAASGEFLSREQVGTALQSRLPKNFPASHITSEEIRALGRGATKSDLAEGRRIAARGQSVTQFYRNLARDESGTFTPSKIGGDRTQTDADAMAIAKARGAGNETQAGVGPHGPDDYANVASFALDPSGEQALRAELAKIGPAVLGNPKRVVTHAETRSMAASIGLDDLSGADLNTRMSGPELLAIRNVVKRNTERLVPLYRQLEAKGTDPEAEQEIAALEQQNNALLSRFVSERSRTGRDLNNLKIMAGPMANDPAYWRLKAQNMLAQQGQSLRPEQGAAIDRLVAQGKTADVVRFVASLRPPASRAEKLVTIWKAGLLTNPTTHLANMLGNTAMAGMETAKDAPAAVLDRLLSVYTGQVTKDPNVLKSGAASLRAVREAAGEARRVMRGVPGPQALTGKWDQPYEVDFKNPLLDAYTKGVFRSLESEDQFFRTIALRRSIAEQARVLGGKDKALVQQLTQQPTNEMAMQALADVEYTTFQRSTKFTRAAADLRSSLGTAGQIVAPFTKTPANIAGATIDYSPLGFAKAAHSTIQLFKLVAKDASPAEIRAMQRLASDRAGRASIGLVPILVGWKLAARGLATGAYTPGSEGQTHTLEGRQENSVKVGQNWRSVERISPLGNLIALGANAYELSHRPDLNPLERAGGAATSIGSTLLNTPFLQGVEQVEEMVHNEPGAYGDFVGNTAASTVPAILRGVARGVDPVMRETENTEDYGPGAAGMAKSAGATLANEVRSGIPGLSSGLPAKRDQLGRVRRRSEGVAGQLLDPFKPSPDRTGSDPVLAEVARTGAVIGPLGRHQGEPITDYQARSAEVGGALYDALAELILSDKYQSADPLTQKDMIEDAVRHLRSRASRGKLPMSALQGGQP